MNTKKHSTKSPRPLHLLSNLTLNGCRYSVLSELPYLNLIKHHVIDPMHNLYLGMSKNMIKIWKDKGVLRPEHFDLIQDRLDEMNIPQGIGRVPNKIHSKFSGLTADQWRNWTNLFSLYALHDVLPPDHYLC